MLVLGRFTLLAWVYVTYMLARGGFYTSTCTRVSHYCGHPLRISLDRVPSTIYACCILHNKALDSKYVHASLSLKLKNQRAGKADFLRLMLFLSRKLKQWRIRKLQLREQEKTFLPEVMPTLDVKECRQGRS